MINFIVCEIYLNKQNFKRENNAAMHFLIAFK